ncbi:four helix bundle protein [Patescibacteria group bacterium]|nr:four helix bundle protein [Patescibacteria group bacterium]
MNKFNFSHTYNSTPPAILPVLEKTKSAYKQWVILHRNLPQTERLGLGSKIDLLMLDLLELLRKTTYTPLNKKIALLESAMDKIDSLRFFVQLLWELQLMSNNQYSNLGSEIENIGKMIGGWKKSIIKKLP